MGLSCTVPAICSDIAYWTRNANFVYPPAFNVRLRVLPPPELHADSAHNLKLEYGPLQVVKKFSDIRACDIETDGRTDRQREYLYQYRASVCGEK